MTKAKVYFTKKISPESLVKMYDTLSVNLPGKVAVKLHSGERAIRITYAPTSSNHWLTTLTALSSSAIPPIQVNAIQPKSTSS